MVYSSAGAKLSRFISFLLPNPVWRRLLASNVSDGEQRLRNILQDTFLATELEVQDVSGGCGSMYQISITSEKFRGKRLIQQHRMVTEALKDEIKNMHGLTLTTSVPE
ncbi:bolA-like protein 3 [Corticium candelabrum]|uniref:bolA-like protein 3 n=1 Tax=Corticium candelabrum TaxID=121492 RepID=UPI002E271EE2|nr:bolA-like protein 3 [Corticium candelabrum]